MNHFFWTKYPFVQVGFAFIGGTALAHALTDLPDFILSDSSYQCLLQSSVVIACGSLLILFYHYKKRISLNGFALLLLFACLGSTRFITYDERNHNEALDTDSIVALAGEVVTEPEQKNKKLHFLLEVQHLKRKDQWINYRTTIKATLADTSVALRFKDRILFKGNLNRPIPAETPYDFDYARFLAYQNIHYLAYATDAIRLPASSGIIFSLKYYAIQTRQRLEALLHQKIKHPKAYALVTGLLVGKRSDLTAEDKQLFTTSGTIHVLAVSGMHVVLIYQSLCFLASLFRIRQHGMVFNLTLLALIWFYIFITGLQASACRAAIMITLVLLGKLVQRDNQNINSLLATACIMLLYNPYYLADAGFILSFLAVVGILVSSSFSLREGSNKITAYLFNASLISTAAQAATFPYSIHLFHQFPVYFLLANLVVVPLTTLLLFLSVFLLLLYCMPFLNDVLVWTIEFLTDGLFYFLQLITYLPSPTLQQLSLSTLEMLLLYLLLCMTIGLFVQRQAKWLWGIALGLTLLCTSLHTRMIWQLHHPAVFISGKAGHRQYLLASGRDALLITPKGSAPFNPAVDLFMTDHFIRQCRRMEVDTPRSFILKQAHQQIGICLSKPVKTALKDNFFKNCDALLLDYATKYSYLDPNNKPTPEQKIFFLYGKKSFYNTTSAL